MLLTYAVSAIVAGVLVVLSLLGAEHAAGDHEVSADHDVHDAGHDTAPGHWLPFFSLRFYTYFFAGFGTTGLLLTWLAKLSEPTAGIISAVVGLGCGLSVSIIVRALRLSESSSAAKEKDMLGKEAQVLVAVRGSTPGRIRLSLRGDLIDFLATTEDGSDIEPGASVVVLEVINGRAVVARKDSILGNDDMPLEHNT
ncbi:MAG: NfeD family protein [Armatimonadetes bacterium]|nr:NfeD family protein [Armatimonadota bacterium]